MTFTSAGFYVFLGAVLTLCLGLGRRGRSIVLLAASYAFYASWVTPGMVGVLGGVTLGSYLCALAMERLESPRRRSLVLLLGVASQLGVLVAVRWAAVVEPSKALFATIGVSYYVLQAVSYLIEVRDRASAAERNLVRYALFLAFFPKLIQGPIERPDRLLPQLLEPRAITPGDLAAGTQQLLWGLFQKVVVADRIAPLVDAVYGDVRGHDGLPLLVATYLFAAQLYFDFAGYTDMALGAARLFGIGLTQNFQAPYSARSVAEFWRRWHMSFSSWLLDYVFRPMQLRLRRWRVWGTPAALLITFVISGAWHGTSWSFIVWGALHGAYLASSVLGQRLRRRLQTAMHLQGSPLLGPLQIIVTFHLVCFAWIFFRARTLGDALYVVQHLASGLGGSLGQVLAGQLEAPLYLGQGSGRFASALAAIAAGAALRPFCTRLGPEPAAKDPAAGVATPWRGWVRTIVYAVMFYLVAFSGTVAQSFIYARF